MSAEQAGIAHQTIDWSSVSAATYQIDQSIRYDYASPITKLRHKLVISPRAAHGDQRRISHELFVSPDAPATSYRDTFGNDVVSLEVPHVERSISFELCSRVARDRRSDRHVVSLDSLSEHQAKIAPRRLIRADEALLDAAADLRAAHRDPGELAQAISDWIYGEMSYTKDVTDVFTTGAVAFSMRRGVCQDYAHVAIAISRACGLAARYVSGHLLGEGATHAWVEFFIPAGDDRAHVLSLDPTNGCATNLRYIVVAVGRDYDDVAPTSGVFEGSACGSIHSRQSVRVTGLTLAA